MSQQLYWDIYCWPLLETRYGARQIFHLYQYGCIMSFLVCSATTPLNLPVISFFPNLLCNWGHGVQETLSLPFLKKTRKWGVGETLSLWWLGAAGRGERRNHSIHRKAEGLEQCCVLGSLHLLPISFSVPELILAFGWREKDITSCAKQLLFSRRLIHRSQPEVNSQTKEDLTLFQWEKNFIVIHPHVLGMVLSNL